MLVSGQWVGFYIVANSDFFSFYLLSCFVCVCVCLYLKYLITGRVIEINGESRERGHVSFSTKNTLFSFSIISTIYLRKSFDLFKDKSDLPINIHFLRVPASYSMIKLSNMMGNMNSLSGKISNMSLVYS